MQSNTIQAKIQYYLKKYPDSKITLTDGQRGTIENDIKEFGKNKKYHSMSNIVLNANLSVNDINSGNYIQQVQHSQDYNSDHDKTINIIFLFVDIQHAIRNCKNKNCYNAVGEATDKDAGFCDDCEESMDGNFWSN